jgi:formate-dependent phosphoribosylglycinamide formyltransferase (GAR transformylase)
MSELAAAGDDTAALTSAQDIARKVTDALGGLACSSS